MAISKEAEQFMDERERRAKAAIETLVERGYTWEGGDRWTPLSKPPASPAAELDNPWAYMNSPVWKAATEHRAGLAYLGRCVFWSFLVLSMAILSVWKG